MPFIVGQVLVGISFQQQTQNFQVAAQRGLFLGTEIICTTKGTLPVLHWIILSPTKSVKRLEISSFIQSAIILVPSVAYPLSKNQEGLHERTCSLRIDHVRVLGPLKNGLDLQANIGLGLFPQCSEAVDILNPYKAKP